MNRLQARAGRAFPARVEAKTREQVFAQRVLDAAKPITPTEALESHGQGRERAASDKGLLTKANKLLGFKLDAKTGEKIKVAAIGKPEMLLHEIGNKHIKALVAARKTENASHWTIKHEPQALPGTIQLAQKLGFQVNSEINWPSKELEIKKGRLRFLTRGEEQKPLRQMSLTPTAMGKVWGQIY